MTNLHLKTIIVFCFIAIIPLVTISYFNHPTIDDFWEIAMLKKFGFPNVIYQWSQTINGRFSANGMMAIISIPFKNIWPYKLVPVLFIFLFYVASITLCSILFKHIFSSLETKTLGILFATCYFLDLPDLYQGLYWLSSSVNYLLSIVCFVFILCWQQRNIKEKFRLLNLLLLFLFSFIASGFNELITIMWIGVMVAFMSLDKFRRLPMNKPKLTILVSSAISIGIQLLSSGNHKRIASYDYENSWSVTKSSILAIEQTGFHLVKHSLLSPLWWFVGLFFLGLLLKYKTTIKVRFSYLNIKVISFAILFMIAMFFFPALVDGNIERNLSGMRIINVSYFVSFAGFLFLILSMSVHFPIKISIVRIVHYQKVLFGLAIISVVLSHHNFRDVTKDLLSGKAALYDKEAFARYKSIEDCKSLDCGIKAFTNPPLSLCPFEDTRVNLMRVADVFKKERIFVIKDSL